jgi:biotin operon repressor
LFSLRDKDKSCFRIFIELLKAAKLGIALSSDELAYLLGLSRGTVIHHINKLMETGIVVPIHKKYILRENNLQVLMEKIREDFERAYTELYSVAQDIDRHF